MGLFLSGQSGLNKIIKAETDLVFLVNAFTLHMKTFDMCKSFMFFSEKSFAFDDF